jgi:hypothetical protein
MRTTRMLDAIVESNLAVRSQAYHYLQSYTSSDRYNPSSRPLICSASNLE